ncbi:hypothetical protein JTE90_025400 [Oedothorax gibbosus]|uniref:Uncharacterized protein n=1 Tax=Oedothorax gibbosus TaxID=931172 RepID=A0AAV6UIJ5_9ARAC|nr:hypothetical protein JTE90_025400 [Oedothorax gibbosus]
MSAQKRRSSAAIRPGGWRMHWVLLFFISLRGLATIGSGDCSADCRRWVVLGVERWPLLLGGWGVLFLSSLGEGLVEKERWLDALTSHWILGCWGHFGFGSVLCD